MSLKGLLWFVLLVAAAGLVLLYWRGHYYTPSSVESEPPITGQYDITASDSGKTFEYPETSRFTVYLDSTKYDPGQLNCTPDGVVGPVSNVPLTGYPMVAKRYEITGPGTCTLADGDFSVTIIGTSGL